ncbi:hypothetical protein ACFLYD_08535, partial [Chloroflexota bacterium]
NSVDLPLLARMSKIRQITALGQAARRQAGIDPDRRLRQAIVGLLPQHKDELSEFGLYHDLVAQLLGAAQVQFTSDLVTHSEWRLALNPDGAIERDVAPASINTAMAALDADAAASLASQLWDGLTVSLKVNGRAITLLPDEVRISVQAQPGWVAVADTKFLVLLETG